MYVARARFVIDRPPGAIDLSQYVTLAFLEKIDPAIKHKDLAAADINPFKGSAGDGQCQSGSEVVYGSGDAGVHRSRATGLEAHSDGDYAGQQAARQSPRSFPIISTLKASCPQPAAADLDQAGLKDLTEPRCTGRGRSRAEHFLRQSDHEIWKILRRVPELSG